MGRVLDGHLAPQVVVQSVLEVVGEAEEHVNAGALDISVDHRNPMAARSQLACQVRGGVALAACVLAVVETDAAAALGAAATFAVRGAPATARARAPVLVSVLARAPAQTTPVSTETLVV